MMDQNAADCCPTNDRGHATALGMKLDQRRGGCVVGDINANMMALLLLAAAWLVFGPNSNGIRLGHVQIITERSDMSIHIVALVTVLMVSAVTKAQTLTHDFLDLTENTCLSAIELAEVPDMSGLTPYEAENPDHNFIGPSLGQGFVAADPRLLIAYGERNGFHACEVSFSVAQVTGEGAAIVDALAQWIDNLVERSSYILIDNCEMFGFKFFFVAGSSDRNPRGQFVRIVAYGGVDPEDDERYGEPRVIIAETPELSAEECLADALPPN